METVSDSPDLLSRLGDVQRELVRETHHMVRAAAALEQLPRGRDPAQALAVILRAACEHLDFQRACAYLVDGEAVVLRCAWPRGHRGAGALERQAIASARPALSRSGKTVALPLVVGGEVAGALRLEGGAARATSGDALAPVMRFAEAAALALENAVLAQRLRSQGCRIESLAARLAEANHRIKNNLQALAGFLAEHERLGSASRRPPGAAPARSYALRASVGRIKTIAALHESLAGTDDEVTDLAALTERICADTAAVDQAASRVKVVVSAEPIAAGPALSRAFALVLHELVSNALQHAYPPPQVGQVRVALRRTARRSALLEVADDGVGLAPGADACGGLGLRIAGAIAENELAGKLQLRSANGATATLEFPLPDLPPPAAP